MSEEPFERLVQEFLGKKRIAIWGVEDGKSDPGRWVANRFRKRGIAVIAVNPDFTDDPAQDQASSLAAINPPVEAVLVYVDRPQTMEAVDDCIASWCPLGLAPRRPQPRRRHSRGHRKSAVGRRDRSYPDSVPCSFSSRPIPPISA